MAIGRVNTGGGGTGGELTINAPAGVTVIAVNSATEKTYTKTTNSSGVAVFKGLPEGGYNVHIEQGSNETEPITVTVAYKSSATIAWFAATINVTYPAGSTCTCTKGNTTFTAVGTSGSYTFTVPSTGTWTVSCTDGTDSDSKTVAITTDGQSASVELLYAYILYDAANDIKTGGWQNGGYGSNSETWGDDELVLIGRPSVPDTAWESYAATYTTSLNLSEYDTLEVTVTATSGGGKGWGGGNLIAITNGNPSTSVVKNSAPYPNNSIAEIGVENTGVIELDISSISSGNICLWAATGYGAYVSNNMHITKVLLK